jgi:hypothetical protein
MARSPVPVPEEGDRADFH